MAREVLCPIAFLAHVCRTLRVDEKIAQQKRGGFISNHSALLDFTYFLILHAATMFPSIPPPKARLKGPSCCLCRSRDRIGNQNREPNPCRATMALASW